MYFLVLLALAWAVVVLPAIVRSRRATPAVAAERFKKRMEMIAPAKAHAGRWVVVPKSYERHTRSHRRQQAVRRRIFEWLLMGAGVLLLVALWRGGGWWEAQLVADGAVCFYAAFLLEAKRRRQEAFKKVRPLVQRKQPPEEITFYEPARATGGRR